MIRATLVGVAVLVLAVGCGGGDGDGEGSADTGRTPRFGENAGVDRGGSPQGSPARKEGNTARRLTPGESLWVTDSRIEVALVDMQRDIRAFTRGAALQPDGSEVAGQAGYGCERKLSRGGRPPTVRLLRIHELALEACEHLESAFRQEANRAAAARDVREAQAPATRARDLLDTATAR